MSGSIESTKIVSYQLLSQTGIEASKIVTYMILTSSAANFFFAA